MSDVVVLSALGAIRIYGGGIFIFIVCRTSVSWTDDFHKKVVDITSERSDVNDLNWIFDGDNLHDSRHTFLCAEWGISPFKKLGLQ